MASIFTTPPPSRPPPPKYPLFTKKFTSKTSFAPGHLLGAGALAFGIYAITKAFISAGRRQSARVLEEAQTSRSPRETPSRSPRERQFAKVND